MSSTSRRSTSRFYVQNVVPDSSNVPSKSLAAVTRAQHIFVSEEGRAEVLAEYHNRWGHSEVSKMLRFDAFRVAKYKVHPEVVHVP
jgi:hypothetical protein